MASLHKNLWLTLEFLKGPFLVLHFSYSTLMTFLMMLFVILLSMLLLLPTLKERNSDLWQQLQLASELESDLQETLDWGRKGLVDFNAGKTQLCLTSRITLVLLMWKWMDLFLRKNHVLRCWGGLNWSGAINYLYC